MPDRTGVQQLELWETEAPTADGFQDMLFSRFELDLLSGGRSRPAAQPRRRALATSSADRSFAARRPLNILVADDNEINRKVIRVILQKLGYSCAEATNGEEALALYHSGEHDYIFMDIDMPEMDGIEATQAIRELEGQMVPGRNAKPGRQAEIIAVTANVSDETRTRCRRAGMNGYLEKPITANMIKDQLLRSWPRVRSRRGS